MPYDGADPEYLKKFLRLNIVDSTRPKERWCIHASAWVYDDKKEHDRREALDELNLANPPDDHML